MARADELAACTERLGEITRRYGTEAFLSARTLLDGWMRAAGMTTREQPAAAPAPAMARSAPGSRGRAEALDSPLTRPPHASLASRQPRGEQCGGDEAPDSLAGVSRVRAAVVHAPVSH
jgi:hypothetical protein